MRTYSIFEYPKKTKEYFKFLEHDYDYSLLFEERRFSWISEYVRESVNIWVDLNYDFRDNFYYFKLIRGKNTKYPNDQDNLNIRAFYRLVQKHEPNFDIKKLQPDDTQYLDALKLNAEMLKKYGDKVLRGEEWF